MSKSLEKRKEVQIAEEEISDPNEEIQIMVLADSLFWSAAKDHRPQSTFYPKNQFRLVKAGDLQNLKDQGIPFKKF